MSTYITFYKMTDQGAKDIKNAPERIKKGIKAWEAMGGKMIGFYVVGGEYDYVSIAEAPSYEVGMTFNFGLGSQGNVRTTSVKAFTVEEFAQMLEKLP